MKRRLINYIYVCSVCSVCVFVCMCACVVCVHAHVCMCVCIYIIYVYIFFFLFVQRNCMLRSPAPSIESERLFLKVYEYRANLRSR